MTARIIFCENYLIAFNIYFNRIGICDAHLLAHFFRDNYSTELIDVSYNACRLHTSPFKAAVLPLSKKLSEGADAIYSELSKYFSVDYDEAGSIGKRYRRQDEIGTPLCITYDFDSETDGCVTVRDRDSMEQVRIPIAELKSYIDEKIAF